MSDRGVIGHSGQHSLSRHGVGRIGTSGKGPGCGIVGESDPIRGGATVAPAGISARYARDGEKSRFLMLLF